MSKNDGYEIKTDCFAYLTNDKSSGCDALKELYCRKENCKFYKLKLNSREK